MKRQHLSSNAFLYGILKSVLEKKYRLQKTEAYSTSVDDDAVELVVAIVLLSERLINLP